jgi:hypothetical protein
VLTQHQIKIITYYNKRLRRTFLAPKTSTSLQTLAADAHLAKGQFLHEEQTNNFQNGRAEFQAKVNLSEKESIEAMPPHS